MTDRRYFTRGPDRRKRDEERAARDMWRDFHRPGIPVSFTVGELMRCPGALPPRPGRVEPPIVCGTPLGHAECRTTVKPLVRPYPVLEPGATHRLRCHACGNTLRFFTTRESAA